MIIFLICILLIPYYDSSEFNNRFSDYLDHLLVDIYYQNIYYQDQNIMINQNSITSELIYYIKQHLSFYKSINNVKIGFYFEDLKMEFEVRYKNYNFNYKISKEVYYG